MTLRPAGIGDEREYARVITSIHHDSSASSRTLGVQPKYLADHRKVVGNTRRLVLDSADCRPTQADQRLDPKLPSVGSAEDPPGGGDSAVSRPQSHHSVQDTSYDVIDIGLY